MTGLYKFGIRYYDPTLGRWTQQDPLGGSLFDPSTGNRYAYTNDDPTNLTDPTGKLTGLCLSGIVGFGIGIVGSVCDYGKNLTVSVGGVGVAGIVAGVGAGDQISNASSPSQLGGVFVTAGVATPAGGIEGFVGNGVGGGGFNAGPGAGGGLYGGATYTWVLGG